jgi:hypothetical protein
MKARSGFVASQISNFVVNLIADLSGLSLFGRGIAAVPVQRLVANDNDGNDGGFAMGDQAPLSVLLELG